MTTRSELQGKTIKDLREIASALQIDTAGLQKAKLIGAIIGADGFEVLRRLRTPTPIPPPKPTPRATQKTPRMMAIPRMLPPTRMRTPRRMVRIVRRRVPIATRDAILPGIVPAIHSKDSVKITIRIVANAAAAVAVDRVDRVVRAARVDRASNGNRFLRANSRNVRASSRSCPRATASFVSSDTFPVIRTSTFPPVRFASSVYVAAT
jgi:hypothetical protein